MTQTERRIFLIEYLLSEYEGEDKISLCYASFDSDSGQNLVSMRQIPDDEREQKILLRGLMNIREPKPIDEDFLKVQDEYLTERKLEKGIVTLADIENEYSAGKNISQNTETMPKPHTCGDSNNFLSANGGLARRIHHSLLTIHSKSLAIWKGDITRLELDAIVNAANSGLTGCYGWNHICIDNAIHTFAGVQLRLECDRLMKAQGYPEPTGKAKITGAYNLPSKYVIHTVGPIVQGKLNERHEWALKSCYRSCLEVAVQNDCKSIAFCCISTGVFMFPKRRAAEIAVETVRDFLTEKESDIKVVFNVFGDEDFEIYERLLIEEK